jgi:hypothetical protein
MMRIFIFVFFAAVGWTQVSNGQLISNSVSNPNLGTSYFESNSIGWKLRGPNWFFENGPSAPLVPPFGGGGGNNGTSGGIGFFGGGVSGGLNFNFAQGSTQTLTGSSASVTTMNGFPGSISSGVVRPFVTGFVPVVSGNPTLFNNPSDQIQQQQLAALRQSQADLRNRKLQSYLERAKLGESKGNLRMARANYRNAISMAAEPLRSQLQQRLTELSANLSR